MGEHVIECPHCGNAKELEMESSETTWEQGLCVTVTFLCRCSAMFTAAIWQFSPDTFFSGPDLKSCAGQDCSYCHPEIIADLLAELSDTGDGG